MTNTKINLTETKPADFIAALDHTDEVYDSAFEAAELTRLLMPVDASPANIVEAMMRTMMDYAVLSYIEKTRDE